MGYEESRNDLQVQGVEKQHDVLPLEVGQLYIFELPVDDSGSLEIRSRFLEVG